MIKDERLKLIRELNILEHQRCPVFKPADYVPSVKCCEVNELIKEVGKKLEKAVNRRKGLEGEKQRWREEFEKWEQVAISNGLSREVYHRRVKDRKWSMQHAATLPHNYRGPLAQQYKERKEAIT